MVLEVKNLNKNYTGIKILDSLKFCIEHNGLILLSGANGSGKSTLFKILMGLEKPQNGEIFFYNSSIKNKACFERINLGLSYMPQNFFLLNDYTVKENIDFVIHALATRYKKPADNVSRLYSQIIDLNTIYDKKIKFLSRGERRKIEFWITLLKPIKLLLLDEPFSGWDLSSRKIIYRILEELKKECSILLIEHQLDELLINVADLNYCLEQGKIQKKMYKHKMIFKSEI